MACNKSYIFSEEELSCPVCFEDFNFDNANKYPYLLLCLHTFCSHCLKELHKNDGSIVCPLCREHHIVRKIEDLMDNYAIHDYLRKKLIRDDEILARKLQKDEAISLSLNRLVHEDEILAQRFQIANEDFHSNLPCPMFCQKNPCSVQLQNTDATRSSLTTRPALYLQHNVVYSPQHSTSLQSGQGSGDRMGLHSSTAAASSSLTNRPALYLQHNVVYPPQHSTSLQSGQGSGDRMKLHSTTNTAVEGNETDNHPYSTAAASSLSNRAAPYLHCNVVDASRQSTSFQSDQESSDGIEPHSSTITVVEDNESDNLPFYTPPPSVLSKFSYPQLKKKKKINRKRVKKVQSMENISPRKQYCLRSNASRPLEQIAEDGSQPSTSFQATGNVALPQSKPKRKYVKKKSNTARSLEKNSKDGTQSSKNTKSAPKKKIAKKRTNSSSPSNVRHSIQVESSPVANSSFEVSINSSQRYNRIKCRIETKLTLIKQIFDDNSEISANDVTQLFSDNSMIQSPTDDHSEISANFVTQLLSDNSMIQSPTDDNSEISANFVTQLLSDNSMIQSPTSPKDDTVVLSDDSEN